MGVNSKILAVGAASVALALGTYIYQKSKSEMIPWKWVEIGKVTKICLFPLKSGHRIELREAEATEVGLKQTIEDEKAFQLRDRCLVVYGERDKEFRTGRTYPKMVLIDVSVHDSEHIALDTSTMRTLYVKIPNRKENKTLIIKLHQGEQIPAIDCGDEAALWISRYILEKDSGLRLGYHDASVRRDITKIHKSLVSYYKDLTNSATGLYQDLTSIMLINQASIRELNAKMGNSSITVDYFRPNIVVDGENIQAYDEDNWKWLKIGEKVVFKNVKDCTRCIMTMINPENGTRTVDREPLTTLGKFRMVTNGPEKAPIMGIHCEVRRNGIFQVGDSVYIPQNSESKKSE